MSCLPQVLAEWMCLALCHSGMETVRAGMTGDDVRRMMGGLPRGIPCSSVPRKSADTFHVFGIQASHHRSPLAVFKRFFKPV